MSQREQWMGMPFLDLAPGNVSAAL